MDLVNNETGDVSEEPGQEVDRLTPQTLMENPVVKQLGVMIGIAASVAIGVAVVLWSQSPSYSMLFGNLSPKDAPEVISALQQAGIEYEVDQKTGVVMVPSAKLQDARMKMAAQGLPHTNSIGFELLQQETGFGTSRALEAARFHRALEGELARTISTLANIEKARVHLATPKQSVFVRKRKKPSASVVVKLYPGRVLDKSQIAAITHLVASSVPELESDRITIVDNRGELLSNQLDKGDMLLTATQFDYTKRFEEDLRQRVVNILTPILGEESVRAQVTAELDFTRTEQTAERYNPDPRSVRSEQVNEQASRLSPVQGVPGALSNQPPAAGIAPEEANGGENGEGGGSPLNTTKRAVRNYELDKTISHTQLSTGALRRLSVAVVVDDAIVPVVKSTADTEAGAEEEEEEEGQVQFTRVQRSPEDINRITELVKEAIGFNATRGDSVRVINAAFMAPTEMEPLPSPAVWEQPWFLDLVKQLGGLLLVVMLILFVLKPTMMRLTAKPGENEDEDESAEGEGTDLDDEELQAALMEGAEGGVAALEGGEESLQLTGPEQYQDMLEAAKEMVQEDSKRVAQVVKRWVAEDAG